MNTNAAKVAEMVEQLIQNKNGRVAAAAAEAVADRANGGPENVLVQAEEAAATLAALGTPAPARQADEDAEML